MPIRIAVTARVLAVLPRGLYGGAPLVVLQIDADMSPGDVICSQRRIVTYPTIQVCSRGVLEAVSAGELEQRWQLRDNYNGNAL